MSPDEIIEMLSETNPEALFLDGFEDALIGTATRIDLETVAAYNIDKIIAILVKDGMTYEEAIEYFDFNIIGAWVGKGTPIFIQL